MVWKLKKAHQWKEKGSSKCVIFLESLIKKPQWFLSLYYRLSHVQQTAGNHLYHKRSCFQNQSARQNEFESCFQLLLSTEDYLYRENAKLYQVIVMQRK